MPSGEVGIFPGGAGNQEHGGEDMRSAYAGMCLARRLVATCLVG